MAVPVPLGKPRPMGAIQINTTPPGVRVTWNGAVICDKTPCAKKPIVAGDHVLRLHAPDGTTKNVTVTVRGGETVVKNVHMK